MKRYIRSNTVSNFEVGQSSSPKYQYYASFRYGGWEFGAHYNIAGGEFELLSNGYVTSYHPYDDADYAWAQISGPKVQFIRDGKILDSMTISDYDESMYQGGFDAYLEVTFQSIAEELINFDKGNVEPKMVHN